jgi:hypothetical protein
MVGTMMSAWVLLLGHQINTSPTGVVNLMFVYWTTVAILYQMEHPYMMDLKGAVRHIIHGTKMSAMALWPGQRINTFPTGVALQTFAF